MNLTSVCPYSSDGNSRTDRRHRRLSNSRPKDRYFCDEIRRMLQKSLTLKLAVSLFAPLNSGAAAWMSMSMADSNAAITAMGVHEHTSPDHHAGAAFSADHHQSDSMHGGAHDNHSVEDCREHCISCSNHCSSLAVDSSQSKRYGQIRLLAATTAELTSAHPDLLFRPPIRA